MWHPLFKVVCSKNMTCLAKFLIIKNIVREVIFLEPITIIFIQSGQLSGHSCKKKDFFHSVTSESKKRRKTEKFREKSGQPKSSTRLKISLINFNPKKLTLQVSTRQRVFDWIFSAFRFYSAIGNFRQIFLNFSNINCYTVKAR